jgi:AraC-like DNA-binding protein
MNKEIPNIQFESNYSKVKGIEIITLESIIQRKDNLEHNPEIAHQLEFNMLIFFTSGKSKHLVDFVWHEVNDCTLLYLSKGQVTAFSFTDDLKGFIILFTEEYFKQQLNRLPKETIIRLFTSHLFSTKIHIPKNSNVNNYASLLFDEFYKEKDAFNKVNIINYLFNIIFSKLEQLKKHQTFHIKETDKLETFLKFKTLLETNYQRSRNADFYAEKLHITYKHLNVISKEIVSLTAKQFIDEFVILEAKRQLINSSIKSTELSFQLGFEEPTNFVKYFKKHTKLTPNLFKLTYNN